METLKQEIQFEGKIFLNTKVDERELYKIFKLLYLKKYQKNFIVTKENKELVYTLLYYFTGKMNFYDSPLLFQYPTTLTNINKGLLIIGGVGCGKTSILKTFSYMINLYHNNNLRYKTAKDIVLEYEGTEQKNLIYFKQKYENGHLIIDDLYSENEANRFGKTEIFETILDSRSENLKMTTIITMNYLNDEPNNIKIAIEELSNRYGFRDFDRILGGFNFIKLQGKSFRK